MKSAAMNFAIKRADNEHFPIGSKETVDIDDLKEAYSRIIITDKDWAQING
ncbi:MAG: hypothetical protein Q8764_02550 [Pigeon pea little leaf phytoplasma]|uniref:Uncharacterized protein n=1 Tax=Candidatus Phytoplasma fabacearum TaxID=2982628 RepID=A0ABU8ZT92_9MOLU|nr:hypothetical protein ['Bituminaria bituminosa' little leaf phytoplasma]MDV3148893.1 hypothetical protein [Pigeon pea little leaf phytoplasma]MDO7983813.1 hypothetical protein ['Bituminaria bituminosa' little leaf phytoplasma]MDO8024133.1 hypothetical protein ['Bituminaria bituminosa' little leaf phytoplasma]MDO8030834.1 hypothetical protein ['Bituminaria bituminosa' little leaf phytoplasma]MDV3154308.1 hypothetical protein [Pigeon pea little leaf phytoplasma]